jgi:hypothetical protein
MGPNVVAIALATVLALACRGDGARPNPRIVASAEERTASTASGQVAAIDAYIEFPASGVRLRKPQGFVKADSFEGFEQTATGSSVLVTVLAAPYSQVSLGFTREYMSARGWTLQSRADQAVNGLSGILVQFDQPVADQVFFKWSLVFGDDAGTTLVTAAFPKTHEQALSGELKAVVLSTQPTDRRPEPAPGLPFTIVGSPKLRVASSANAITYTRDGATPIKAPADPLFVAAPSLGKNQLGDRKQFALQRLQQTAAVAAITLQSMKPVIIDGLGAYESIAHARETKTGTPVVVYQVILFDENSYILMEGQVGLELSAEFLPEFKAMAKSLKRNVR